MNNWWNTLGAGSIVGSFQIVERLGEGGNAVVFRARSEQQPEVALKILKRLGPTGPAYQRFKDEISTMRALSNDPGILPILDSSLPLSATPNDPAWLAKRHAIGAEGEKTVAMMTATLKTLTGKAGGSA